MSLRTLPSSLAGFALALLAFTPAANAHIRLLEPLARYEITGNETGIKQCPCGLGESMRAACDLSVDASDPARSTRVTRAEAGSTLTLRFSEYIGHSGTYRVAFDPDGAEVADFNATILVPMVADPPGNMGNVGEGNVWEIEVPLPDMTCTNCTLQLVQAMNGDMVNPVANPGAVSSYYSCVDLELVAPGTMAEPDDDGSMEPEGMGAGGAGTMGSGAMGSAGAGTTGAGTMGAGLGTVPMMGDNTGATSPPTVMNMGAGTTMTGVGSLTPMATAPTSTPMSSGGSEGGCSLGSRGAASPFAALALAGAFALLAQRRRARGQK
jgi:hypothetical protein